MTKLETLINTIRDLAYDAQCEAADYNEWSRDENDPPPAGFTDVNDLRQMLDKVVERCDHILDELEFNKDDLVKFIESKTEAAE